MVLYKDCKECENCGHVIAMDGEQRDPSWTHLAVPVTDNQMTGRYSTGHKCPERMAKPREGLKLPDLRDAVFGGAKDPRGEPYR